MILSFCIYLFGNLLTLVVRFFGFKIFAKIENECEYAFGSILSPLPSTSTVHLFAKKPVHKFWMHE